MYNSFVPYWIDEDKAKHCLEGLQSKTVASVGGSFIAAKMELGSFFEIIFLRVMWISNEENANVKNCYFKWQ